MKRKRVKEMKVRLKKDRYEKYRAPGADHYFFHIPKLILLFPLYFFTPFAFFLYIFPRPKEASEI